MKKIAMISGARGQDASYLSELLLDKGYIVVAFERRISSPNYDNIKHLLKHPRYVLEQGDITDFASISSLLKKYKVDEFYNLAAQSFVGASWQQSISTCNVNFMGVVNCIEAIRLESPKTRFYQASTSEVYGDVITDIQNEETPPRPRSPYGASKHGAESIVKVYRDSYDLYACVGRLFNHESARRGAEFVTRKITSSIGNMFHKVVGPICDLEKYLNKDPFKRYDNELQFKFDDALKNKIIEPIRLGNMEAKRDWSHAKDMVYGMWLMLQQEKPDDYVLASGETYSISQFLEYAFGVIGIEDCTKFIIEDPKFYRPADVNLLCGDSSKARKVLGWNPKYSTEQLIEEMVLNDIRLESLK